MLSIKWISGGAMRDRTADLLRAKQALSQLSYSPIRNEMIYGYTLKYNYFLSRGSSESLSAMYFEKGAAKKTIGVAIAQANIQALNHAENSGGN